LSFYYFTNEKRGETYITNEKRGKTYFTNEKGGKTYFDKTWLNKARGPCSLERFWWLMRSDISWWNRGTLVESWNCCQRCTPDLSDDS
jgi:hypothetical protein